MTKILVVKREDLFKNNHFEGFKHIDEENYIDFILNNHYYEERCEELENNPEHIQIIPYVWIINPKTKQAFIYKRALGKDYQETRHVNKLSGGVGGHIDQEPNAINPNTINPITHSMKRELSEELIINQIPEVNFIGYINDDSNMYNKVHFAIVGLAETEEPVKPTDDGIESGSFHSIEEIEQLLEDPNNEIESWTQLSWPSIKKHLQNLDNKTNEITKETTKEITKEITNEIKKKITKKIWPNQFKLIEEGNKTYDIRLADFNCNPGDTLVLKEWNPETLEYTGKEIRKLITNINKTKNLPFWNEEDINKHGLQIISFK